MKIKRHLAITLLLVATLFGTSIMSVSATEVNAYAESSIDKCEEILSFVENNFDTFVDEYNKTVESEERLNATSIEYSSYVELLEDDSYGLYIDFNGNNGYAVITSELNICELETKGDYQSLKNNDLCYSRFDGFVYKDSQGVYQRVFTENHSGLNMSPYRNGNVADNSAAYGSLWSRSNRFIGTVYYRGCKLGIVSSVTSIGDDAFCFCDSLTAVTFGENSALTAIGDFAFSYCTSLESFMIPAGVMSIGSATFSGCEKIETVTIPDSVNSIGDLAFLYCWGLTDVAFGENSRLASIGEEAFSGCRNLKNITIPSTVESIGNSVFSNCKSLETIVFNGTTEQWNAVEKESYWDENTPNYTVCCTNGDIAKS